MKYNVKKLFWLNILLIATITCAMDPEHAGPARLAGADELYLSTSSDKKQEAPPAPDISKTAEVAGAPLKTTKKRRRRRTKKLTLKDRATRQPEPADDISTSTQDSQTPISKCIPDCLKVKMGLTEKAIDEVLEILKEKQPTEYENFLATITQNDDKQQTNQESKAEIAASLFKLMYQHVVSTHQDLAAEHSTVKGSLKETQTALTTSQENEQTKKQQRNLSVIVGFIVAVIQFVTPYITGATQDPTCTPCNVIVFCANNTLARLF